MLVCAPVMPRISDSCAPAPEDASSEGSVCQLGVVFALQWSLALRDVAPSLRLCSAPHTAAAHSPHVAHCRVRDVFLSRCTRDPVSNQFSDRGVNKETDVARRMIQVGFWGSGAGGGGVRSLGAGFSMSAGPTGPEAACSCRVSFIGLVRGWRSSISVGQTVGATLQLCHWPCCPACCCRVDSSLFSVLVTCPC